MSKPALGRGLSALLGGKPSGASPFAPVAAAAAPAPSSAAAAPTAANPTPPAPAAGPGEIDEVPRVRQVPVGRVRPSALQPRRDFPAESLRELADSIREQGILQPLVVRPAGEHLELIAGERRWRAAQLAGLPEVPVIVREADDTTALELMLVENLQREDLNPIDEAQGYAELLSRFQLTQEAVATKVGRSRTAVANALRFLRLPVTVQAMIREGQLSAGHAKVILGLPDPADQASVAATAMANGLSVRQVEELVTRHLAPAATPSTASTAAAMRATPAVPLRDPHVASLEDKLRQRLGTKVTLRYRAGRGQVDIRFFSDAELERVLEIVGISPE